MPEHDPLSSPEQVNGFAGVIEDIVIGMCSINEDKIYLPLVWRVIEGRRIPVQLLNFVFPRGAMKASPGHFFLFHAPLERIGLENSALHLLTGQIQGVDLGLLGGIGRNIERGSSEIRPNLEAGSRLLRLKKLGHNEQLDWKGGCCVISLIEEVHGDLFGRASADLERRSTVLKDLPELSDLMTALLASHADGEQGEASASCLGEQTGSSVCSGPRSAFVNINHSFLLPILHNKLPEPALEIIHIA